MSANTSNQKCFGLETVSSGSLLTIYLHEQAKSFSRGMKIPAMAEHDCSNVENQQESLDLRHICRGFILNQRLLLQQE